MHTTPFLLRLPGCVLAFLCLCLWGQAWAKPQTITLEDRDQQVNPLSHAQMFLDSKQAVSLENVDFQGFYPCPSKGNINLGYTDHTLWVRFKLAPSTRPWLLEVGYASLDFVDLYVQYWDGRVKHYRSGDQLPFWQRPMRHRHFVFPLDLDGQEPTTVYIKVRTQGVMQVPLQLYQPQAFAEQEGETTLTYGLIIGAIICMCLFNLLMYVPMRDVSYLLFPIPILGGLLFNMSIGGLTYMYLVPGFPYLANTLTPGALGILIGGAALFASKFLQVHTYSRPLWYVLMGFVGTGLAILGCAFYDYTLAVQLANIISLPVMLSILIAGMRSWSKGYSPAKFFTIGWVFFMAGMSIYTLRAPGILPDTPLTAHAMNLGMIAQVLVLSVAIGDRYRQGRLRELTLQQQLLEEQQRTAGELEALVAERTLALQQQQEELLVQNEHLQQYNEQIKEVTAELEMQQEELSVQRDTLLQAQGQIERQNRQLTDSIRYGYRIQAAVLPPLGRFRQSIPDSFVLHRPKDLVSGDLYWLQDNEQRAVIAVLDCQGQGVPAAFLTLLAEGLLKQIVLTENLAAPAQIMARLNQCLRELLGQHGQPVQEQVRLSVCTWYKKRKEVAYAGNGPTLWYTQQQQLLRIKGDNLPVGNAPMDAQYREHHIALNGPTCLYLGTDGLLSQRGGPQGQSFGESGLQQLLMGIYNKPMAQQQQMLEELIDWWMQGPEGQPPLPQQDDILLLGIRL